MTAGRDRKLRRQPAEMIVPDLAGVNPIGVSIGGQIPSMFRIPHARVPEQAADGDAAEDGRHVQLDGRGGAEEVSRDGELRGVVVLVTLDSACDSAQDRVARTRVAEFLSWVKARVHR